MTGVQTCALPISISLNPPPPPTPQHTYNKYSDVTLSNFGSEPNLALYSQDILSQLFKRKNLVEEVSVGSIASSLLVFEKGYNNYCISSVFAWFLKCCDPVYPANWWYEQEEA